MAMSKVIALYHAQSEGLGTIARVLHQASIQIEHVHIYRGDEVPRSMGDARGLLVMGGPMSVYEADRCHHLRHELSLIEDALSKDVPLLGVCLGSQLLAAALGAQVIPGERKEIGWYDVSLSAAARKDALFGSLPSQFKAFHWHGDIFELPRGAQHLASSDLTAIQAFRFGHQAYGILFHLEVTGESVALMADEFEAELLEQGSSRREMLHQTGLFISPLEECGETVFSQWAALVLNDGASGLA